MKTKIISNAMFIFMLMLFISCSNDDSSVTGYGKDALAEKITLSESQAFFEQSISEIYEPNFNTLAKDMDLVFKHLSLLFPQWDDFKLSEDEDRYILGVSLVGNSFQRALISDQAKTDDSKLGTYKMKNAIKSVYSSIVFIKDKKTKKISYQIATILKGASTDQTRNEVLFSDAIIYSDKEGKCNQLMAISNGKLGQTHEII